MAVGPDRRWTTTYAPGTEQFQGSNLATGLALFHDSLQHNRDSIFINYFDGALTYGTVDSESTAFAGALRAGGFARGDRLGIMLQNTPQFAVAVIAAWKLGGTAVPINPMSQMVELEHLLDDANVATLLVDEGEPLSRVLALKRSRTLPELVVTSPLAYQSRNDSRVLPLAEAGLSHGLPSMVEEIARFRGRSVQLVHPEPEDAAFLIYTSGTTGKSKGAVNHHSAVAFSGASYRNWIPLSTEDRILGLAPMAGTTGLITGFVSSLASACTYVLHYRFNLAVVRDAIAEHAPTFTVATPTVYFALLDDSSIEPCDVACLVKTYCGGAVVPPALVERWRARFGGEIRTAYGLTEATGPTHLAPRGQVIPVDPETGALAIGVPIPMTDARVVDMAGEDVPPGSLGELIVKGPQVIRAYWRAIEATRLALSDGWLRTGDLVRMDDGGWFYLVERIKDVIVSSGWKIIPREVEDVLYSHPAVREAAIIGVPHPQRGEIVHGYVALVAGATTTTAELIAFVRRRLSAYKCPSEITLIDDLPKSNNGKILKRELREQAMHR